MTKPYDPKCEELARYFLPHAPDRIIQAVAEAVQAVVEDLVNDYVRDANGLKEGQA